MARPSLAALLGFAMLALLSACSGNDDMGDAEQEGATLQIGACMTRAEGTSFADATRLDFFLTSGLRAERRQFVYYAAADRWSGSVRVQEDNTYQLYGYMSVEPMPSVSITHVGYDYADGAQLTLSDLPVITQNDLCLVTAVKGGSEVTTITDFDEWHYDYTGREEGENQVYFLLDHLYAQLCLNFRIQARYAQMRSVKLKKVQLRPSVDAPATFTITQNHGQRPAVDYVATSVQQALSYNLFESTDGVALQSNAPLTMGTYLMPNMASVVLLCTYDVYDKEGNLIRRDCKAENELRDGISQEGGTKLELQLTIAPSYFYVLSDDDADDPVVNIEP